MKQLLKYLRVGDNYVEVYNQEMRTRERPVKLVIYSKIKNLFTYHEYSDELYKFLVRQMKRCS